MRYKVLISAPCFQKEIEKYRNIFQKNNLEIVLPKVIDI